ncbi:MULTISPECIES: hypothetical protein [Oscillatoriales]|jgi:hypothetical protein|uniref:VWFA domain-containing protein n=1 Tax=Limnospira platensis NIES-46 TaxID=1236695 RepID=A0A5M3T9I5_LIMPL|nr:hypothetical protein [Arthrospira platensis]KDR58489.1 hypothetical protein APPUASWS_004750 [Arthrospira platensis str. Paraca]MDF2208511.1 hypothetical protein [Arthrospira platensis NCB002]MDT9294646.1 hypothetical protein [Arthrospira platensis PCC 7345]MDT9310208.1 hypothetical protein [Limnospira sp. Paracas R14]BAI94017.1 hypothetical protein NIES39_Q00090 [Arthrospira platensis NIES-39]
MSQKNTINKVDLVVIIDTSSSLRDDAATISNVAEQVIENVTESYPCDLEITWLGIEGIWHGTPFSRTLRNYLINSGVNESELTGLKVSRSNGRNDPARGDGAGAIADACNHFDWRLGANRAIFYLGELGISSDNESLDLDQWEKAIAAAKSALVRVHSYRKSAGDNVAISEQTGGLSFIHPLDDQGWSSALLSVVAASFTPESYLGIDKYSPSFELICPQPSLGENQVETVAIAVTNKYSNITFRDVTVFLSAVTIDERTPVPNLPDEIPPILLQPNTPIYFGDIDPYNPDIEPVPTATIRPIQIETRGSISGEFWLNIDYSYSAEFSVKKQETVLV